MATEEVKTAIRLWDFKRYSEQKWFNTLILTTIITGAAYLLLHVVVKEDQGFEYELLDEDQIQHITSIYYEDKKNQEPQMAKGQQENVDTLARMGEAAVVPVQFKDPVGKFAVQGQRDKSKKLAQDAQVLRYINLQFANKVYPAQMDSIRDYLRYASEQESINALDQTRFRVESYFWLIGPAVYFEIMFWSWFGVLASILFSLGMVARNSTTDTGNPLSVFDASEIPSQIAKMVYAPLCTLAIVLGYNFFNDQNIVDISSSKGVIVFAFVGGFFSSRLVAFMERLKELIMPLSGTTDLKPNKAAPLVLQNVPVKIQLDEASIPAEQRTEIAETGLSGTAIVFENEVTGEKVEAVNSGEDQSPAFSVSGLKAGTYTVKAAWSGQVADTPMSLESVQTVDLRSADVPVEIILKKAEGAG